MSADIVGYSRLMGQSESGTLARLKASRAEVVDPAVADHGGRIFKTTGDGVLVEFPSAVDAVQCGVVIQAAMAGRADGAGDAEALRYRIGVHVGDIIIDGDDILGEGVNVAARIEGLADPGGVAISDAVNEHVRGRIDVDFHDAGAHEVKNIERPLHVWTWNPGAEASKGLLAGPPALPDKPSIAVLPFDNMSGDAEQGYFADGITEDIITDLSKVSGLFVIARNSSFAYRGQASDIRKVSRELGVRYVLEGSVRRSASKIRINAQMIDGATGGHLWAERYDRDLEDIFAVQDEVTRTIVSALKVKLTAGEQAIRESRSKVNPQAYDLLVRAREIQLKFSPENALQSRRMLEKAIEIDPGLAPAYARLSMITFAEYANRWNGATADNLTQALALAQKAIDADGAEPQGHIARSLALSWLKRLDEAEAAAERAVALDPNAADAHTSLGLIRDFQGRHEDAVDEFKLGYRLDPQFEMALHFLGRALLALGRLDEADTAFKQRLARQPRSDMTRFYLAALYGRTGRHDEARRLWDELREINPNFSVDHLRRSLPYRDETLFDRFLDGLRQAGIDA